MGEGKKHLEKVVEDMHTTCATRKANPIDALDPPLESFYEIEHDLFLWEENEKGGKGECRNLVLQ